MKILQCTAMAIAHERISKVSSIIATCFGYWIYGQHLILSVAHGDHFVTPPAAQEYEIPLQMNPFYLEEIFRHFLWFYRFNALVNWQFAMEHDPCIVGSFMHIIAILDCKLRVISHAKKQKHKINIHKHG